MFNMTPDNSIPSTDLDSVLLLNHGTHLTEALLHVGLEWHQILWRTLFVDDEAVSQQGYLGDNGSHSTAFTDLIKLSPFWGWFASCKEVCASGQNWKCVAQHSLSPQLCLTLSLKTSKWNPWCILKQRYRRPHTWACAHTHTHTLSLTHTHSLSHTHTHSLSHTHTLSLSHIHTHTHTLSLSHSLSHIHTHTHTHTHSLSFSVYDQNWPARQSET